MGRQIDTQQSKISTQVEKEKQNLAIGNRIFASGNYQNIFINQVNEFQTLQKREKLDQGPEEAKKYFIQGENDINSLLRRAANRGAALYNEALAAKANKTKAEKRTNGATTDKSSNSHIIFKPSHITSTPATPKSYESLNITGLKLRTSLEKYTTNIKTISILEKQFNKLNNSREIIKQQIDARVGQSDIFSSEITNFLSQALSNSGKLRRQLEAHSTLPSEYLKLRQKTLKEQIDFLGEKKLIIELYQKIYTSGYSKYFVIRANLKNPLNPKFEASKTFKNLPLKKKKQIMIEMAVVKIKLQEDIKALTAPQATVNFWRGIKEAEQGDLDTAQKTLHQFLDQDIKSTAFTSNSELVARKESYKQRAQLILQKVEQATGDNKEFFQARKLLANQNLISAKKLLLIYYEKINKQPPIKGKIDYRESARQLLIKICQTEYQQVKEKFAKITPPQKYIIYSHGIHRGLPSTQTTLAYTHYKQIANGITKLKNPISTGKYLDFATAVRKEKIQLKFSTDSKFDVIGDQIEYEKGKEGILALARKYHQQGNTKLAEQYFELYFRHRLNRLAQTSVTINQLKLKYDANPTFHYELNNRVKQAKQEYLQRFGKDYVKSHPFDDRKAYNALQNAMLQKIRPQEVKLQQQEDTSLLPPDLQPIWNEYAEMEGIAPRKIFGHNTFAISDKELHQLVQELPINIAIIAVSGGISGLAGGAISGALLRIGMSEATAEAATFGVISGARRLASYAGGLLVENTVFTSSNAVIEGIRSGHFNIRKSMQNEWAKNLLMLGALGVTGRFSKALEINSYASYSVDIATMGAIHGQVNIKDIATILGLRWGHDVMERIDSDTNISTLTTKKESAEQNYEPITISEVGKGIDLTPRDNTPREISIIGKKAYFSEQISKVTNDNPLQPYLEGSTEFNKITELNHNLNGKINTQKLSESIRQNPDQSEYMAKAWSDALLDQMTGLYNRHASKFVENWIKAKEKFSVASFDGDYFGSFNKLKGTHFGDVLIKVISENFHNLVNKLHADGHEAIAIREGGEEIKVYIKGMDSVTLAKTMDQFRINLQQNIIHELNEIDPHLVKNLIEYLQASGKIRYDLTPKQIINETSQGRGPIGGSTIGIVEFAGDHPKFPPHRIFDNLNRSADRILEQGKISGRNRVIYNLLPITVKSDSPQPGQLSQATHLHQIYYELVDKTHAEFNVMEKVRGWKEIKPLLDKVPIKVREILLKIINSTSFNNKLFNSLRESLGQNLDMYRHKFLEFHHNYLIKLKLYDSLTGLPNNVSFGEFLNENTIKHKTFSTYNLDIKLKSINEVFGHIGGDTYLMKSAEIIKNIIKHLPIDFNHPKQGTINSHDIALFRKPPTEGTGFHLVLINGNLSSAQLRYCSEQYSNQIKLDYYDRIGVDPSKNTPEALQIKWINKHSHSPTEDIKSIGTITITQEIKANISTNIDHKNPPPSQQPAIVATSPF